MENPNCQLCNLHSTCNPKAVCLKGEGNRDASLLIFMSYPAMVDDRRAKSFVSDEADLLKWFIKRMSLTMNDVYLDYVLKCHPKQNKLFGKKPERMQMIEACSAYRFATLQEIRPKAIVAMGAVACEAFIGKAKVAEWEGTHWIPTEPQVRDVVEKVWITFAPGYALQSPAECVTIYRTIFNAAMDAGLNPKTNLDLKHYDFGFR